jgi:hypothetical protein
MCSISCLRVSRHPCTPR